MDIQKEKVFSTVVAPPHQSINPLGPRQWATDPGQWVGRLVWGLHL